MKPTAHDFISRPLLAFLTLSVAGVIPLQAATYHVAPSGNDTNNPGTLDLPFQTIQKAANVAVAGDTVIVRAGTYRETVVPANSGSVNSPITYQAYEGETVIISGADVIPSGSWSLDSGAIYSAPLAANFFTSSMNQALQVFVDGEMVTLAKWPNTTTRAEAYPTGTIPPVTLSTPAKSTITSFVSKSSDIGGTNLTTGVVADTALPTQAANFYAGAKIFFQPNNGGWSWAFSGVVTASSGTQFTFQTYNGSGEDGNEAAYKVGSRYYLFDKAEFLDTPGEWFHDRTAGRLRLWLPQSATPASHAIEVKKRDYAFNLSSRSHLVIRGFRLFACTITTDTAAGGSALGYDAGGNPINPWRAAGTTAPSSNITLDRLEADYLNHFTDVSGHFYLQWGTGSGIVLSGSGHRLTNCVLRRTAGNGVNLMGTGHLVFNNRIEDAAYSGIDCSAISANSAGPSYDHEIAYNTVRRTSRSGITPRLLRNSNPATDLKARIHHNDIANFGLQDWDVGGLYIASADGRFARIDHNHFSEGVGYTASGIYIDYAKNYIIDHNIVWNVEWGIKLQGQNGGLNNTLVYNNTVSVRNTSGAPYGPFGIGCGSGTNVGTVLKNNILTCNNLPSPGYAPISTAGFSSAEIAGNLAWDGVANSPTDPRWVAPPTTLGATGVDFRLQSGSAAIDAAVPIGSYTRDGVAISPFLETFNGTAADTGALEFGAASPAVGADLARVVAPETNPAAGTHVGAVAVTLSTLTPGASIRYTVDGSMPDAEAGTLYTGPIPINTTTTLRAIATAPGLPPSSVTTATFTISPPPVISLGADSLSVDLPLGSSSPLVLPVLLANLGSGPLTYSLSLPSSTGYTLRSSRDAGGPAYAWDDVSATGTRVTALNNTNNSTTNALAIGFSFPFFGTNYSTLRICTNGWLSFTSTSTNRFAYPLPSTSAPAALIAPLMTDLRADGASAVYTRQTDASTFVVQFQNLYYNGSTSQRVTFQVVLRATGEIEFRYNASTLTNLGHTIGLQNAARNEGLLVAYNPSTPYIAPGLRLLFAPPRPWFAASPVTGSVSGGGSIGLTTTWTAGVLPLGTYTDQFTLDSNDPNRPSIVIPLTLRILETVDPPATPASLTGRPTPSAPGVVLSWTDVTGETGYLIERAPGGSGPWTALATVGPDTTSYSDLSTVPGSAVYRVSALNGGGSSSPILLGNILYPTPTGPAYESFAQNAGLTLNAVAASGSGFGTFSTTLGSDATVADNGLAYTDDSNTLLSYTRALRRTGFGTTRLSIPAGTGTAFSAQGYTTSGTLGGYNADGRSLYFAVLVRGASAANDIVVELADSAGTARVGIRAAYGPWGLQRAGNTITNSPIVPIATQTTLAVLRIDFSAGATDTARLYLNPVDLAREPGGAQVTLTGLNLDGLSQLVIFSNGSGEHLVDEIRFGRTWSEAVPLRFSPIEKWLSQNALDTIPSPVGLLTADTDGDGRPTLLEYALDTPPASPQASNANYQLQPNGDRLQLSFLRAREDVTYLVEASADLVTWTNLPYTAVAVGQTQTVTDTVDISTANPPRRFLRLHVTLP